MAYGSHGRRPIERASKISHAQLIQNPTVKSFLKRCAMPAPAKADEVEAACQEVDIDDSSVRAVVAVDGSYRTTPVREEYPSASITFFSFGALLFDLEKLAEIDAIPFIDPDMWSAFKKIQRYSLVLPTENVSLEGRSLVDSVRVALHEFLATDRNGDGPLADSLRWLLLRKWAGTGSRWEIPSCPNAGCDYAPIILKDDTPDESVCPKCNRPIYFADALRLHERIETDESGGGICAYVMNLLEHLAIVHVIRITLSIQPALLSSILFIKDGPLAFFGNTAPLRLPMRELAAHLMSRDSRGSQLLAVGVEKSGAFCEHADQIAEQMPPGSIVIMSNDYVYRHIVPGDPASPDAYGANTYWGNKLIFRAPDKNMYVATVPTGGYPRAPQSADFSHLPEVLGVLARLRCSMYDNALIPVALANKLVSLSEYPSTRILQAFATAALSDNAAYYPTSGVG